MGLQGLSLEDLLKCQLYSDEDVFLADLSELPALQRCGDAQSSFTVIAYLFCGTLPSDI